MRGNAGPNWQLWQIVLAWMPKGRHGATRFLGHHVYRRVPVPA